MKHSFWGYFVVLCGVVIIVILLLVQRMTTTSEEDFYLAREVMEASMIDAVDYGTYRTTGKLVMSEQKFVEIFIRRFAENVTNNKTYKLEFYDIYEEPPKASVRVRTSSGNTANIKDTSFDVTLDTLVNGILETIYGQASEGNDDGDGGNGDNTVPASCPGDTRGFDITPTLPNDDDDDGNNPGGGGTDGDVPLVSPQQVYYSIGYVNDLDKVDAAKIINGKYVFEKKYTVSYTNFPIDLAGKNIIDCDVVNDELQLIGNSSEIQKYAEWKRYLGLYYVGADMGDARGPNFNDIHYFVNSSEFQEGTAKCRIEGEGANKKLYVDISYTISLNLGCKDETEYEKSKKQDNGVICDRVIEKRAPYYRNNKIERYIDYLVYIGVKWKLKFTYKR